MNNLNNAKQNIVSKIFESRKYICTHIFTFVHLLLYMYAFFISSPFEPHKDSDSISFIGYFIFTILTLSIFAVFICSLVWVFFKILKRCFNISGTVNNHFLLYNQIYGFFWLIFGIFATGLSYLLFLVILIAYLKALY